MTEAIEVAEGISASWGEAKPCADPDCHGMAEVEQDGELKYLACPECGYEFGWERVLPPSAIAGGESCSVGIPEATRRAVSGIAEAAQQKAAQGRTDLGSTIGRRPGL